MFFFSFLIVDISVNLSNKIRPNKPVTPEASGSVKPRKLEPMTHKIPAERNNLAGLRLPVNYSGKTTLFARNERPQ